MITLEQGMSSHLEDIKCIAPFNLLPGSPELELDDLENPIYTSCRRVQEKVSMPHATAHTRIGNKCHAHCAKC